MRMSGWSAVAAAMLSAGFALAQMPAIAGEDGGACATSRKYIALLQQRKFQDIGQLFAADAVFYTPVGTTLRGAEAIGAYYKTAVANANLVLRGQNYVGTETECYFEIWHRSKQNAAGKYVAAADGEFARGAADHFTVNDKGLVVEMVAFPAGAALPLGGASGK